MAAYATLAELRAYVAIPAADTADDTNLTLALAAATAQVEAYTNRIFPQDATVVARAYMATSPTILDVDPFATTDGLLVSTDDNGDGTFETAWTLGTDFRLEPINAAAEGQPWTRLVAVAGKSFPLNTDWPSVKVTAKFGWAAAIPPAVKQAVLIQASRLFKRKDSPFGVAGSAEFGSELRLLSRLDPDVENLLAPYRPGPLVA